jgi:hypothetical protein
VQRKKLPNAINHVCHGPVVTLDAFLIEYFPGKLAYQLLNAVLDKEDARRFQRFYETTCEANGDTVLYPGVPVPSDPHLDMVSTAAVTAAAQVLPEFLLCCLG